LPQSILRLINRWYQVKLHFKLQTVEKRGINQKEMYLTPTPLQIGEGIKASSIVSIKLKSVAIRG